MENVKLLECPPALFLILYELIQLTDHKAPRYIFLVLDFVRIDTAYRS